MSQGASADREAELKKHRARAEIVLAADHFAALGLQRNAGPEDAQRAFVEAAKQWHPDRVPAGLGELTPLYARVFSRLEFARGTLTDPQRRKKYLDELLGPPKPGAVKDAASAEAALEMKKAEVLLKKNDNANAERHLRRVVELTPANVTAAALLVWVQVKPGSQPAELVKLAAELDRIIQLDANCERAIFFRAQLRKRMGREKEAHADFIRAAELDKHNIDAQREVRLYNMRNADASAAKAPASGVGGFLQKLFKR